MLRKLGLFLFGMSISLLPIFAQNTDIFNYPKNSKIVASQMPKLPPVMCKFSQTKAINSSSAINSGGNFTISKNNVITFETLYPIVSTVKYSSNQNKQISNIITSIKKNNYAYLEKNFNLYFNKINTNWILALKPKNNSPIVKYLKNIIIQGDSKNITQIIINSANSSNTSVKFKDCKPL